MRRLFWTKSKVRGSMGSRSRHKEDVISTGSGRAQRLRSKWQREFLDQRLVAEPALSRAEVIELT